MYIQVLKSRIHRVRVTQANLNYVGNITIDRTLVRAVGALPGEHVQIVDYSNGNRLDTYITASEPGSRVICPNGPAACLVQPDDIVIIMFYTLMDYDEARTFRPKIIFPDSNTDRLQITHHLANMFGDLSERLEHSFKILKGQGHITEINVAETLKDVRRILLDTDVNYNVARDFIDQVKGKALDQNVLTAVNPGQMMVKIVRDELTALMGSEAVSVSLKRGPAIVLMSELQGSGKATFPGRLTNMLQRQKQRKPLLVACDIYRPTTIQQPHVLEGQIDIPVYSEPESKDPAQVVHNAIARAQQGGLDIVIIDTAGRLAVGEEMMNEINSIREAIRPDETLFAIDSMTGQDMVNMAAKFDKRLNFGGVTLTKLSGDSRGSAALSIHSVVNKPVKFVGTGEKMEALQVFHPSHTTDHILGMGDIVSLVKCAQQRYDEEEAERLEAKIAKNQFDPNDFLAQIARVKKVGNLKDLVSMIPGIGKMVKGLGISNDALKGIEAVIHSMTPEERAKPSILDGSHRKRIAGGSGTSVTEVSRPIQQFDQVSEVMRKMQGGGLGRTQAKVQKKNGKRRQPT